MKTPNTCGGYMKRFRISVCEPTLGGHELEYVTNCIKTNWISSKGNYLVEFEGKFSRFCNANHGIATSSGTTALHLALVALGIGRNDEVILPTLTMIASANPVIFAGATPVFVDSEPYTWNIDVNAIEEKITDRTKAIMPVHIYGHPVDMDPLLKLSKKHNLFVVEDAAEAHGAEYRGNVVGCLGNVGCFSFYTNKIVTTGEGGMAVTNNDEIAERLELFRDLAHSKEKRYLHYEIGFNYRMTNLQAAIGLAQMERIEEYIDARRKNAKLYTSFLKDVKGITPPPEADWAKNIYWLYSILIQEDFGTSRDELVNELAKRGIETRPFFIPMHKQPVFKKMGLTSGDFPIADELCTKGICLPSSSSLEEKQLRYVCDSIKEIQKAAK
jgi:perosamine synthetase